MKKLSVSLFLIFSVAVIMLGIKFFVFPTQVFVFEEDLYNVPSYVIENGKVIPDGIRWDEIILVNPKIYGELVEIPYEVFFMGKSERKHYFFRDVLKKAKQVFLASPEEKIWSLSDQMEIKEEKNISLDKNFLIEDRFYITDPEILKNGGDTIFLPENMLIFPEGQNPDDKKRFFFFRHQLALLIM